MVVSIIQNVWGGFGVDELTTERRGSKGEKSFVDEIP